MSFESNLKAALNGKKVEDLQNVEVVKENPITLIPTPAMMMQVIEALRLGTPYRRIQLTIQSNKRILTVGQIKQINQGRLDKISELLTPEPEIDAEIEAEKD